MNGFAYFFFVSPYPDLGTRSTTYPAGLACAVFTGTNRPGEALRPNLKVFEPLEVLDITHSIINTRDALRAGPGPPSWVVHVATE